MGISRRCCNNNGFSINFWTGAMWHLFAVVLKREHNDCHPFWLFLFIPKDWVWRSRIPHHRLCKRTHRKFGNIERHHVFPHVLRVGRTLGVVGTRWGNTKGLLEDLGDIHIAFHDHKPGKRCLFVARRERVMIAGARP